MCALGRKSGSRRGWRVGHGGRDAMYYEELRDAKWARLDLSGEMLTGRAHHVIYFGNREDWKRQPEWAQGRRDEIIDRIKSAFPIPDYEYDGEAILGESDRARLIEAAGGLSDKQCKWAGCSQLALKGKALCVLHFRDSKMWR